MDRKPSGDKPNQDYVILDIIGRSKEQVEQLESIFDRETSFNILDMEEFDPETLEDSIEENEEDDPFAAAREDAELGLDGVGFPPSNDGQGETEMENNDDGQ